MATDNGKQYHLLHSTKATRNIGKKKKENSSSVNEQQWPILNPVKVSSIFEHLRVCGEGMAWLGHTIQPQTQTLLHRRCNSTAIEYVMLCTRMYLMFY